MLRLLSRRGNTITGYFLAMQRPAGGCPRRHREIQRVPAKPFRCRQATTQILFSVCSCRPGLNCNAREPHRSRDGGRLHGGGEQFHRLEQIPIENFGPGVPLP